MGKCPYKFPEVKAGVLSQMPVCPRIQQPRGLCMGGNPSSCPQMPCPITEWLPVFSWAGEAQGRKGRGDRSRHMLRGGEGPWLDTWETRLGHCSRMLDCSGMQGPPNQAQTQPGSSSPAVRESQPPVARQSLTTHLPPRLFIPLPEWAAPSHSSSPPAGTAATPSETLPSFPLLLQPTPQTAGFE